MATRFFDKASTLLGDALEVARTWRVGETKGNQKEKDKDKGAKEEETKEYWDATEKRLGRVLECMGRCWMRVGERRVSYITLVFFTCANLTSRKHILATPPRLSPH